MKWRNAYDEEENKYYDNLVVIDCKKEGDEGMTLQAPTEEQDINVIMKRFGVKDGSILPRWHDPNAMYGDFTGLPADPVEAAEYLRQGEVAFASLPADIRVRFQTGAKLYNWLQDDNNLPEAIKLGILEQLPEKAPQAPGDTTGVT